MTNYENDPNYNHRARPGYREEEASYAGWIIGALAVMAVLFGGVMLFGRDNGTTNNTSNTTTAPTTTGSGVRNDPVQPTNPSGNKPTAPGSPR